MPRGAGWGSQCGTDGRRARRRAAGPRPVWGAKFRGQDARTGHRGRRTGSAVRGHDEVKDISARGGEAGVREPACALACVRRLRAGGKLEGRPRSSGPGPVGAPWAAGPWEAASGGSAVTPDKGMQGGRAGFPSSDPEARRPLPAASPASGAGAGLARHLLRIDAAAASRASRAPGMQRRWRAGPCLERGRARSTPDLSIRLSLSCHQSRCWGIRWQARDVGSRSPCSPAPSPRDLPHGRAFSSSQEPGFSFQILMLPLATSVALDKSLNLSGSVSTSVKRCW